MPFFQNFIRHPQQLGLRRLNFQIHLWAGVILALYVTAIGVSGSILVFAAELSKLVDPNPWRGLSAQPPIADLAVVIKNLRTRYPHTHVISIMAPTPIEPVFKAIVQTRPRATVAVHPATGVILGEVHRPPSRLEWIYQLHENLLAGRAGRIVNGFAAASLLSLLFTGLVNWWPGIEHWRRALKVDFRRRWKRINFDLHSAVGFWSFCFLLMWALTGIYFVWPDKILAYVNQLSPIVNSLPKSVFVDPASPMKQLDFHAILAKAESLDPGAQWKGMVFPSSRHSPIEILMSRSPGLGRDYEDTLYFNPYNGEYVATWQYGVNRSAGDWLIWLQVPLHFGTHWGPVVKCVWALVGLALPLLAVSGLLMYWNRFLVKRLGRPPVSL